MASKSCSVVLVLYLVGSTLCVIPEGEYQIGPVFGNAGRFFGHKYFEAFIDKGQLKPLLAKKVLLGVGAVAAAGGAALIAKKIHENKGIGHGGWYPQNSGVSSGGWYPQSQPSSGWYPSSSVDYSQGYGNVNFPSSGDYQYPTSQGYAESSANNGYSNEYSGYQGWSK